MTFVDAVRAGLKWVVTPFTGGKKRSREGEPDEQSQQARKWPAVPGSTKKTLQFEQDRSGQPAAAKPRHLAPTPPQQVQVQQAAQQQPPAAAAAAEAQQPVPHRRVGEAWAKQGSRPVTAYNSPLAPTSVHTRRGIYAPVAALPLSQPLATPGSSSVQARLAQQAAQPSRQQPSVQLTSAHKLPPQKLGRSTLLFGQGAPAAVRSTPSYTQVPASNQQRPPAASRFAPRQQATAPAAEAAPAAATRPVAALAMGQHHGKHAARGEKPGYLDHRGRDLLRQGVQVAQQLEQEHRAHLHPAPAEVVDLTAEEGEQQQGQQAAAQPPPWHQPPLQVLPLPAAGHGDVGSTAATRSPVAAQLPVMPGGGLPFSPSLLHSELRKWYEAQQLEAALPAAAPLPVAANAEARRRSDEEYRRLVGEYDAAKQRSLEVHRVGLRAAGKVSTALEELTAAQKQALLEREMKQIEEQLQHRELWRRAAKPPAAAARQQQQQQQGLGQAKFAPVEDTSEFVVAISSGEDDEAQGAVRLPESSSVARSEEAVEEQLAELAVEELLPLPEEAQKRYDKFVLGKGDPTERLAMHERSQIEIRRKEVACMAPRQWLNDEVINVYMALLLERDMRLRAKGQAPKCHFFSTFFTNKLYKDTGYNYKDVARWTLPRRLKIQGQLSESILDCDRVILPVHQGMHWVCAVIDLEHQRFVYYDSLKGEDHACLDMLAQYVADEYKNKRKQEVDTSGWERVFPKNIPQQHNGCDCGVFTLLFADYAGRDAPMAFSQRGIDYFRVKIVNDIINQQVD